MILDCIDHISCYGKMGIDTGRILQFIERADREKLGVGRYELDGERMFVMIQEYETKRRDECLYESHRKYMDIQYIARGDEIMYVSDVEGLKVTEDRTPGEDAILYENTPYEAALLVKEGHFALFLPQDGHMPCCQHGAVDKVRKYVFKVLL